MVTKKVLLTIIATLIICVVQAQNLFEQGEAAMKNGEYNKAIKLFEKCYASEKSSKNKKLCNSRIADCQKQLAKLQTIKNHRVDNGKTNQNVSRHFGSSLNTNSSLSKYPEIKILGKELFSINVDKEGGSYELPVSIYNAETWTATEAESEYLHFGRTEYKLGDWIEITERHTSPDNQTIEIDVLENEEIGHRTKEIQLVTSPTGKTARIIVNQKGLPESAHCAYIQGLKVEHNKKLHDGNGMILHLRVRIRNMANKKCKASVFFYYDEDNPVIDKDENGDYGNIAGNVVVGKEFMPTFDDQTFTDIQLSIPYSQLHQEGIHDREIKMRVNIYDYSQTKRKSLKRSDFYTMLYSPEDFPADRASPIVIEDLKVEHDIEMSEDPKKESIKGLLIKFRMETNDLKGKNCQVFAQFFGSDYNPIMRKEDDSQQVESKLDFKPITKDQTYSLVQLQMPYKDIKNGLNIDKAMFRISVFEESGNDLRFLYDSNYMEIVLR